MRIEVRCEKCGGVYRFKEEHAGRMARCKSCGETFRIPDPAEIEVPADEPVGVDDLESIAQSDESRIDAYDIGAPDVNEPREQTAYEEPAGPLLPPIVGQFWLPLVLTIAGYGIALYLMISRMAQSHGPMAGFILIGAMALVHLLVAIPLTKRAIEAASRRAKFRISSRLYLQTAGLLALPTVCGVMGLLTRMIAPAIVGVVVGLALMLPALAMIYSIDITQALRAAGPASMSYLMSLAGGIVVLVGLSLALFPAMKLNLPWQEPPLPPVVEKTAPAPKVIESPTTVEAPVVAVPEPVKEVAPPPPVVKAKLVWIAAVDPGQSVRWPTEFSYVIDVKPPASVVMSGDDAFAAVIDADSVKAYDLRTGKRLGLLKEQFTAGETYLSAGGRYFLGHRAARPDVVRGNALEVWSVPEARALAQFPGDIGRQVVGFADEMRMVSAPQDGSAGSVAVWDIASAKQLASYPGEAGARVAISPGGKYLASLTPQRLSVCTLDDGKKIAEAEFPDGAAARAMRFSNDGSALAAIVGDPLSAKLVIWNMTTGKIEAQTPLAAAAAGAPLASQSSATAELRWLPDDQAVLVNQTLFDRATGTPYYKIALTPAANYIVRPRAMLSNFHVLQESTPLTATRLILKATALPRAELEAAIRAVRGADWTAPEIAPAPAAVAEGPASAPAARVIPLLERVKQKQWTVSIVVVRQVDVAMIDKQIAEEQAKMPGIDARYNQEKAKSTQLESEYATETLPNGQVRRTLVHSDREIGEQRVKVDRIMEEARKVKQAVARLNREKVTANTTRTVVAKLDDGTQIEINCEGAAMISAADGLPPGSTWLVSGNARISENVLHIRPQSFTPAQ